MIFDIIGFVVGLIQQVIQFVVSVINALIGALNAIFGALWNALVNAFGVVADLFKKIGAFFVNLWTNYVKPAVKGLIDLYQKISARLHQIFDPLLRIINRVRAWYYLHVYKWIKLAEDILSTVRVILTIFRALGAKWAAKLDRDIQRIQAFLSEVNQTIVGTLNTITTWLNIFLDPAGVFRPHFMSNSLFASLGAVKRAAWYGANVKLSASDAQQQADDGALVSSPTGILTANADGSVTLSDASKRMQDGANEAVAYYRTQGARN